MDSIRLSCGAWTAQIEPSMGMNLTALREDGRRILREPQDIDGLRASPALYGMPLLLPPNRTRDGMFLFDGRAYQLTINEPARRNHIHGCLHKTPFTVLESDGRSCTGVLHNGGGLFPFPFSITIRDALSETGWTRRVTIQNTGRGDMPLVLGFHTTFEEPETFSVPLGRRFVTDERFIPTGEMAPLTPEQRAYTTGASPRNTAVGGIYEAAGGEAAVGDYAFRVTGFDQWILFNGGGGKGYLCIEPQLGEVNALGSGRCARLRAGQTQEFTLEIRKWNT